MYDNDNEIVRTIDSNGDILSRIKDDFKTFNSSVETGSDGVKLNPIQLKGVEGNPKDIGVKLAEINDKARTRGETLPIGSLYGFTILVKTESSIKDQFDFHQNRFFIEGEGHIKYSYNNGHIATEPKLATLNFLNALEKIPSMIERYETDTVKITKDLKVLEEVVNGVWKKEDELKDLKDELTTLDRAIQLSLKPIEQYEPTSEAEKVLTNDSVLSAQTDGQDVDLAQGSSSEDDYSYHILLPETNPTSDSLKEGREQGNSFFDDRVIIATIPSASVCKIEKSKLKM